MSLSRPTYLALLSLLAVTIAIVSPKDVAACSTPVYRYAMYNWATAPFEIYYFYEGEAPTEADAELSREEREAKQKAAIAAKDLAVQELFTEVSQRGPDAPNMFCVAVNTADEKRMERLYPWVKAAWESHAEEKPPVYLIMSTWGVELYCGKLTKKDARALIESPVRKQLAELLSEGNASVLVLLEGSDAEANAKAEKVIDEVISHAGDGGIPAGLDMGYFPTEDEDEGPKAPGLPLGTLKLSRDDKAEEWLVRMLLQIEPDLKDKEFEDKPMVFAAYGRGRAMEPYIGEGVSKENLIDVVMFLASACSCQVKAGNPGVDLLIAWDWETAADEMAANDPEMDANGMMYDEFDTGSYEDLFPTEPGEEEAEEEAEEETEEEADEEVAEADSEEAATEEPVVEAVEEVAETVAVAEEETVEAVEEETAVEEVAEEEMVAVAEEAEEAVAEEAPVEEEAAEEEAAIEIVAEEPAEETVAEEAAVEEDVASVPIEAPEASASVGLMPIVLGVALFGLLLIVVSVVVVMAATKKS